MRTLASEFPFEVARRGYAVGSAVLQAILPPHDGPTATVPVSMGDEGLATVDAGGSGRWVSGGLPGRADERDEPR